MATNTKKEKFNFHNNLVCLVKGLEGMYTTIDFRNESFVTGRIMAVDGFMNVELEDVVYYDARGFQRSFVSFYVQSRNIRYVHIPEGKESALQIIQNQLQGFKRVKATTVDSRKNRKAKQYHQETLANLSNVLKSDTNVDSNQ